MRADDKELFKPERKRARGAVSANHTQVKGAREREKKPLGAKHLSMLQGKKGGSMQAVRVFACCK